MKIHGLIKINLYRHLKSRFIYVDNKNNSQDRGWIEEEVDCRVISGKEISFIYRTTTGPESNSWFDWAAWAGLELVSTPLKDNSTLEL